MKIHKITERHVGRVLKCYNKDIKDFVQYEYILKVDDWGHYQYIPWRKMAQHWEQGVYPQNRDYYWEPISDLELVVLGIPFPENYVRESDRTK